MKTRAIIDADSILWTLAYSLQKKDPSHAMNIGLAQKRMEEYLSDICEKVNAHSYIAYIGCNENKCFRHSIWSPRPYKGNRPAKDSWMELWEPHLRQIALESYNFKTTPHIEADDAVSIAALTYPGDSVICGIDKDLLQIPGRHYNYREGELIEVSQEMAYYSLYRQMITGDSADNIPGIEGMGKKAAEEKLDGVPGFKMRYAVLHLFVDKYGEYEGTKRFFSTYRLCKLLTPEQASYFLWTLPVASDFKALEHNAEQAMQEAASDISDLISGAP
jgi:hypothetical protein